MCSAIATQAEDSPALSVPTEKGRANDALELLKEETVSIATRYEQPISQSPSNVYVITDEDIRHSGATDIPTVLRPVPGLDIMQVSSADFNVSARGGINDLPIRSLGSLHWATSSAGGYWDGSRYGSG